MHDATQVILDIDVSSVMYPEVMQFELADSTGVKVDVRVSIWPSLLVLKTAVVPSVNVPSPSFQKSLLVPKSPAIARSGQPSLSRSEKAEANPLITLTLISASSG